MNIVKRYSSWPLYTFTHSLKQVVTNDIRIGFQFQYGSLFDPTKNVCLYRMKEKFLNVIYDFP